MRAFGGPGVLQVEEVPVRRPGDGEVLVRVTAVSVGRLLDVTARAGKLSFAQIAVPHILGAEHVGVVQRVGGGVDGVEVGDRVAVFPVIADGSCQMCLDGQDEACPNLEIIGVHRQGAYATYTTVPARQLHRIPAETSDIDACALALAGPVSRRQLDAAGAAPGAWVLVQAAGSALGACAAMLAKFDGANVIGTTRNAVKVPALTALGLDAALNWESPTFVDDVMALTGGRGVDIVIDNIGDAAMFLTSTAVLATGGVLVSSGAFAGGSVTLDLARLYLRNQQVLGVRTGNQESVRRLWDDVARGFRTAVDTTFSVRQAADAHRYVEHHDNVGRVVLTADWSCPADTRDVQAPESIATEGAR